MIGSYTFNIPGTYTYNCGIGNHVAPGMVGNIFVNNSQPEPEPEPEPEPTQQLRLYGKITYDSVPCTKQGIDYGMLDYNSIQQKPIRFAKIELIDNNDNIIETSSTDMREIMSFLFKRIQTIKLEYRLYQP